MLAINSFLSISDSFSGPTKILLAATRSSFSAEIHLAKTASAIVIVGMPRSKALSLVHFPVPFCPAVSRIISTTGFPVSSSFFVRISEVISIR